MEITREVAAKVLEVIDAGLVKGVGRPVPGQMCVEAAVCYALGLPHGDEPTCVSPALRELKICLNDLAWSSRAARAAGLRRLGLAQLGSKGLLDEVETMRRVAIMTTRLIVPRALRLGARSRPMVADRLEQVAKLCERRPTRASALNAREIVAACGAPALANIPYFAWRALVANEHLVGWHSVSVIAAMVAAPTKPRDCDTELAFFAEEVVKILIEMKAPGCQWLDLAPLKG